MAPHAQDLLPRPYCHASSAKSLSTTRCSAPGVFDVVVCDVGVCDVGVCDVGVFDVGAASSVKAESSASVWEPV